MPIMSHLEVMAILVKNINYLEVYVNTLIVFVALVYSTSKSRDVVSSI